MSPWLASHCMCLLHYAVQLDSCIFGLKPSTCIFELTMVRLCGCMGHLMPLFLSVWWMHTLTRHVHVDSNELHSSYYSWRVQTCTVTTMHAWHGQCMGWAVHGMGSAWDGRCMAWAVRDCWFVAALSQIAHLALVCTCSSFLLLWFPDLHCLEFPIHAASDKVKKLVHVIICLGGLLNVAHFLHSNSPQ